MVIQIAQVVLLALVSCQVWIQSAEAGEQADRELAAKRISVVLSNADWVLAKKSTGKTEADKKRTEYLYGNRKTKGLLMISIIEEGQMPADESEVADFIKRFEGLGYIVKGCRFVPEKRNTFLIEDASRVIEGSLVVSTMVFIQGDGEIYCIMGTVVDEKPGFHERISVIRQVSLEGNELSERFLGVAQGQDRLPP